MVEAVNENRTHRSLNGPGSGSAGQIAGPAGGVSTPCLASEASAEGHPHPLDLVAQALQGLLGAERLRLVVGEDPPDRQLDALSEQVGQQLSLGPRVVAPLDRDGKN